MKKETLVDMITQIAQVLDEELNEQADRLAKEVGLVQRERKLTGADFAQELIFAWWEEPDITLGGLVQVGQRREVSMSPSGISQRFNERSALFFERLLERLTARALAAEEAVPIPLVRRFSEVVIEDSSTVSLPEELKELWTGCGGSHGTSAAAIKLFPSWDVSKGRLYGPYLRPGRHSDGRSPFDLKKLKVGGLYLADLGFFSLARLALIAGRNRRERRYFLTRWQPGTILLTRQGHRLVLVALLPHQVGDRREFGALAGVRERLPVRVLIERVPPEVAEERRVRIRKAAQDHGREASAEVLEMAQWTILLTNVPTRLLSFDEVLIFARLRWQIERLYRLWKEGGHLDEWRSKKPWRILTEIYAKLSAMVIQQWLLTAGCWMDPERSLVKAAQALRREANRIMVALYEGGLEATLRSVLRCLKSGCQLNTRQKEPSTAQLLLAECVVWPEQGAGRQRSPTKAKKKPRKAPVTKPSEEIASSV
jgi:hypothetical protein